MEASNTRNARLPAVLHHILDTNTLHSHAKAIPTSSTDVVLTRSLEEPALWAVRQQCGLDAH